MIDIGMALKSDSVIEFLERYDLSVRYEFDRLHEGQTDSYTVVCEELAMELRFNAEQTCSTVFMRDPGSVVESGLVQAPLLQSPLEVEAYAKENSLAFVQGFGWCRCDGAARSLHYEFVDGTLTRVTVMAADVVPRG